MRADHRDRRGLPAARQRKPEHLAESDEAAESQRRPSR